MTKRKLERTYFHITWHACNAFGVSIEGVRLAGRKSLYIARNVKIVAMCGDVIFDGTGRSLQERDSIEAKAHVVVDHEAEDSRRVSRPPQFVMRL